ncbi:type II toxin-antitoxin system Phd/YefM family antitoxin [Knoellia sp. CPCC 206453]
MSTEPLRDVRNHFSDVIARVEREHERVTVTRNGRAAAVIMSPGRPGGARGDSLGAQRPRSTGRHQGS